MRFLKNYWNKEAKGKWMGQQLVRKEDVMLRDLSATDQGSVCHRIRDVLFQDGFVKSTFKDAVIDKKIAYWFTQRVYCCGRYTTYRCRTY